MPEAQAPAAVWGRRTWTAIGVVILLIGLVYVSSTVSVLLTPFVLALFPAALLDPLARRLRASPIPNAVGSLLLLLLLFGVFGLAGWFITSAVSDQLPDIVESVTDGLDRLESNIAWSALPGDIEGLSDLVSEAGTALASSGALTQGLSAAGAVGTFLTGLVLMLVTLFFFFKDGRRMWEAFLDFVPRRHQRRVDMVAEQSFWTIGSYLRGQLLVAFFDAVFIGLGLWLLGVPLVLPLAVLVFFGGLFPIVGAFLSGAVAVVVALADQGPVTALLALGVVLLVQQIEGNLLQPLIQSHSLVLHPLMIIFAVTAGGVVMGILGAFLGVPVAAVIARIVDNLRKRTPQAGPAAGKDYQGRELEPAPEQDDETPRDDAPRDDAVRGGTPRDDAPPRGGPASGGATALS